MSKAVRMDLSRYMNLRECPTCLGARLKKEGAVRDRRREKGSTSAGLPIRECSGFSDGDSTLPAGTPRDGAGDEGDPTAAPFSAGRRNGLPLSLDRAPRPLRRRGPADPAGHADRVGAGRRPLRPRRADRRPPPAGQRPPDRDPEASARHGEHGPRRGARRGHDTESRPGHRHGPGAGVDGGQVVFQGTPEEICRRGLADRGVPLGRRAIAVPETRRSLTGQFIVLEGRTSEQPPGDGRPNPRRRLHRGHRGLRLGEEHDGDRDPLTRRSPGG